MQTAVIVVILIIIYLLYDRRRVPLKSALVFGHDTDIVRYCRDSPTALVSESVARPVCERVGGREWLGEDSSRGQVDNNQGSGRIAL